MTGYSEVATTRPREWPDAFDLLLPIAFRYEITGVYEWFGLKSTVEVELTGC